MTFAGEEPLLGTLKLTAEVDSAKKEEKDFTNLTYTRTSEEAYKGSNSVVLAREKGMISSQAMKVQKGGSFTYQLAYKASEISTLSMVEDLDNGKKSGLLATIPLLSVGEIMTPNTENKSKLLNFNVLGLLPIAKQIINRRLTKSLRLSKFAEKAQASISFRIYSDSTLSAVVWEKTVSLQEVTQWQTAKDSLEIPENGYLVSVLKNENNKETLLDELEIRTYGTQKAKIIQENHYEPFGMTLQGLDYVAEDTRKNSFLFGGKELSQEMGLEGYDFVNRGYDPQRGQFNQIDPLADKMRRYSPYVYCFDNPMRFVDPDGMQPQDTPKPKENSPVWGKMVIMTNVNTNAFFLNGHSWIQIVSNDGTVKTLGTWGNQGEKTFFANKELDDAPAVLRETTITENDIDKINAFNSNPENIDWSCSETCAHYAASLWNHITGENLDAENAVGLTTPTKLAESIVEANGGKSSNSPTSTTEEKSTSTPRATLTNQTSSSSTSKRSNSSASSGSSSSSSNSLSTSSGQNDGQGNTDTQIKKR